MSETVYPQLTLAEVSEQLIEADSVLIFIHRSPDGDCVGSSSALARILTDCGKRTAIACADPVPHHLSFLLPPWTDGVYRPGMEAEFSLVMSLDTASPSQLGALSAMAEKITLSVDHHGVNTPYCANHTEPDASATAEILYDLYFAWKAAGVITSDPAAARCLYAGILSDTGCMKFPNTTSRTFRAVSVLFEEIMHAEDGGDDVPMLCHRLFESRTVRDLQVQRLAIENLVFYEDGRIGVVAFSQETLAEEGLTFEELSGIVSLPRSVEGVEISLSVRQDAETPEKWSVSSRSVGDIDVSAVCASFGGGGHKNAAGCTITAPDERTAVQMLVDAFRPLLKNGL